MNLRIRLASGAMLVALPGLALAHLGNGPSDSFSAGLLHPLTGADHLCAMLAVGAWAAMLGRRASWLVPATFLAVMATGAAWAVARLPLAGDEPLIALSAVALGALVAYRARPPLALAMAVVGTFAFAHGYAHGTEMPVSAAGLAYGAGFVGTAALLHGAGIVIGRQLASRSVLLARCAGGAVAAAGAAMVALR